MSEIWKPKIVQIPRIRNARTIGDVFFSCEEMEVISTKELPKILKEYKRFIREWGKAYCACGGCPICENIVQEFLRLKGLGGKSK